MLDAISAPVLILDAERRVLYRNTAADKLLDGRFGAKLRAGRLQFRDAGLENSYQAASDGVMTPGKAHKDKSASVPLLPDMQGRRAVLHLALVSTEINGEGAGAKPNLIAIMGCQRDLDRFEHDRLRKAFGFSAVEGDIAGLLLCGDPPRQIAKSRQISEQTVRWHIKNIHSKTHTRRLPELLLQIQAARSPF